MSPERRRSETPTSPEFRLRLFRSNANDPAFATVLDQVSGGSVRRRTIIGLSFLLTLSISCSTTNTIDLKEPKRVLGREENVRLDAQLFNDRLASNATIHLRYAVENLRPEPIAVAELVPATTYDAETRTLTIVLGSEVPGNQLLPRLGVIASGETKTFDVSARVAQLPLMTGPLAHTPQQLRVELVYLSDIKPFEKLIGIPEKAISDAVLANELFQPWIENSVAIYSNAIPIDWSAPQPSPVQDGLTGRPRGRRN